MAEAANDVTHLLAAWRAGDTEALDRLLPIVYRELKSQASRYLRRERSSHTLQTTALVHEAYLRLAQLDRMSWQDRAHFFAVSARLMRRVLVDHARRLGRDKRGGDAIHVLLDEARDASNETAPEVLALHEALEELAQQDTQMAQIVELRYFGGLNRNEIALVLDISTATVTRRWRTSRAWLRQRIAKGSAYAG